MKILRCLKIVFIHIKIMVSEGYIEKLKEIFNTDQEYTEEEIRDLGIKLLNFYKTIQEILNEDGNGNTKTELQKNKS